MYVILLAAGRSSRLDPISDKNLLRFGDKALIEHQVEKLKKVGLKEIIVVGNDRNLEEIRDLFNGDSNISTCEQIDLDTGMKGGIIAAAKTIKSKEVLVVSSNDLFDDSLFEAVLKKCDAENDGVIAGKEVDEYFPGGYLKLNENEYVTDIIEKPGAGNEPSKLVNLVCHAYKNFPAFLNELRQVKSSNDDLYEVALDNYIKNGAKIVALKYAGYWYTIKYPWHILKMMNHFLNKQTQQIHPSAYIAKTAIIEGNVVIEKNVKVLHNAVIKGPTYIGEGSIIANNSLVRGSMIGKNCVTGFTTEVVRSYLSHDVWTHTNYIGDSIVDSNVSFGAGTVLGNLRFDEANVKVQIKGELLDSGYNKFGAIIGSGARFGINSSTNPGVKIGRNCFIGGNVLVEKDMENATLILLDQKLKMMKNERPVNMGKRNEMKERFKE